MINIIKHGEVPEAQHIVYCVTCSTCGCVFECTSEDLTRSERSPFGHSWVACPDCGNEIVINHGIGLFSAGGSSRK